MKRAIFLRMILTFLATLVLICAGVLPALAYYPPLQDITGPTVVGGQVNVSVHNNVTGQDIPYTWTPFGGTGPYTIDSIAKTKGIVGWRVKDNSNNTYVIAFGVYDPSWAALQNNPQSGWQFYQTYPWTVDTTSLISLNDGVVVYETESFAPVGSKTTAVIGVYTYDPSGWYEEFMHGWMLNGWRGTTFSMTNYESALPEGYAIKDGVVAFTYLDTVSNAVYDGHQIDGWSIGWRINPWIGAPSATNLQITNATVTWTDTNGNQKWGYDFTQYSSLDDGWISGQNTKVMSCFDFWPTPGKPGQPVWFTDMSIGATAWEWTGDDGGTSTNRSGYHTYARPGQYLVTLDVTGPNGSDTFSQTVPVTSSLAPGSLMLLLGN